jgi:hypothetical protein
MWCCNRTFRSRTIARVIAQSGSQIPHAGSAIPHGGNPGSRDDNLIPHGGNRIPLFSIRGFRNSLFCFGHSLFGGSKFPAITGGKSRRKGLITRENWGLRVRLRALKSGNSLQISRLAGN